MNRKLDRFNHLLSRFKKYRRKKERLVRMANPDHSVKKRIQWLQKQIDLLFLQLTQLQTRLKLGAIVVATATCLALPNQNAQAAVCFGTEQINAFSLTDAGDLTSSRMVDIDNDGDLDLFSGDQTGNFKFFENTGSASSPDFGTIQTNPFSLTTVGTPFSIPTLADLDNDGDLDLLSGEQFGNFKYFENTGTASSPDFGLVQTNPFGLATAGLVSAPSFVDLDNDGDYDIMSSIYTGAFTYFENTGSASSPAFAAVQSNPFGLSVVGPVPTPSFGDLDGDGDLDMISGVNDGNFHFFENTGSVSSPAFAASQSNPFNLTDIGDNSTPTLADIDNDGDLDLISGEKYGSFSFFPNNEVDAATGMSAPTIHATNAMVDWGDVTHASKFRVRWWVKQGGGPYMGRNKKASFGSHMWLTGLAPGTTYKWQVGTWDSCGTGTDMWSAVGEFTTLASKTSISPPTSGETGFVSLQVAPNPSGGLFTVAGRLEPDARATIEVRNLLGQGVIEPRQVSGEQFSVKLDLRQQPKGIYLVSISRGDDHWVTKLVKTD